MYAAGYYVLFFAIFDAIFRFFNIFLVTFAKKGYESRLLSMRKIFMNLMFYLGGNKFFAYRHQAFDNSKWTNNHCQIKMPIINSKLLITSSIRKLFVKR